MCRVSDTFIAVEFSLCSDVIVQNPIVLSHALKITSTLGTLGRPIVFDDLS